MDQTHISNPTNEWLNNVYDAILPPLYRALPLLYTSSSPPTGTEQVINKIMFKPIARESTAYLIRAVLDSKTAMSSTDLAEIVRKGIDAVARDTGLSKRYAKKALRIARQEIVRKLREPTSLVMNGRTYRVHFFNEYLHVE